jgi:hypothetical protein
MNVRYRILSGHIDRELFRVVRQDMRRTQLLPITDSDTVRADTPLAVQAKEGAASLEDVRKRVLSGELKQRDLVDVGAGWEVVEECLLLDEACKPHRRKAQRTKQLIWTAVVVLIFGLMGVVRCLAH